MGKGNLVSDERTNEAVGVLTEAARESFRAVVDGAAATQRQSLSLLWGWAGDPAGSLERTSRLVEKQVEINQRTTRALTEQFEKQREAVRTLALESGRIYLGLAPVSSIMRDESAPDGDDTPSLPIEGYDRLGVEEISERLGDLDGSEIERIRLHEKQHRNRRAVLERLDLSLV